MSPVEDDERPCATADPVTDTDGQESKRSASTAAHGARRVFSRLGVIISGVAIALSGMATLWNKVFRAAPTGFAFWATGIGIAVLAVIVLCAVWIIYKTASTYLRTIEQASKAADAEASEKVDQHLKVNRALVDGIISLYRPDRRNDRHAESGPATRTELDLNEHNGRLRKAPYTPGTTPVVRSPIFPST